MIEEHPIVAADAHRVYVQWYDGGTWPKTAALDWATGQPVWEQETLEGAGCYDPPPMVLTSNGVLDAGGNLVGLGVSTFQDGSVSDCALYPETELGLNEEHAYAAALDPQTGDFIGQPLTLPADRMHAGQLITTDGSSFIVFAADGMSAQLDRLDLTDGTATGTGLNEAFHEGNILAGSSAGLKDLGDDNYFFEFHDGPHAIFTVDKWGTAAQNEPETARGQASLKALFNSPTCPTNVHVTRVGASYCVLYNNETGSPHYEFELYTDGEGTSGHHFKVPARPGITDQVMYAEDSYAMFDILIPGAEDRKPQFVVPGADASLIGYDAVSGEEAWRYDSGDGRWGSSPHVLVSSGEIAASLTTDNSGEPETVIIDVSTGAEVERRKGTALGMGNFVIINSEGMTAIRGTALSDA